MLLGLAEDLQRDPLALLVYTVLDTVNVGWGSTGTLLRLAGAVVLLAAFVAVVLLAAFVAIVLLAAFVAIELRQRHPLVPFSIFRLRTLRGANIVGLLIGMSLFSTPTHPHPTLLDAGYQAKKIEIPW